jgi:hypothetical protein
LVTPPRINAAITASAATPPPTSQMDREERGTGAAGERLEAGRGAEGIAVAEDRRRARGTGVSRLPPDVPVTIFSASLFVSGSVSRVVTPTAHCLQYTPFSFLSRAPPSAISCSVIRSPQPWQK